MNLNETQKHYAQLITEELHVTDKNKLNWMAQYAQIHAIHEGVEVGGANGSIPGYNPGNIYATPLNTMGIANPMLPAGNPKAPFDAVNGPAFHDPAYMKGSGDVPMSTLSTALEIAAVTIGFDLVPVVPSAGPMAILTFNDYAYAGGKLGLINETALDGKGDGADNKPIYIKLACQNLYQMADIAKTLELYKQYEVTCDGASFKGLYMGTSRIDGGIILQVESCMKDGKNISIAECFRPSWKNVVTVDGKNLNINTQTFAFTSYANDHTTQYGTGKALVLGSANGETTVEVIENSVEGWVGRKFVVKDSDMEAGQYRLYEDGGAINVWVALGEETDTYYPVVPELVKGVTDHIQSFSNFFGKDGKPSEDPMERAENETGTGNVIGARMFSKVVRMGSYEAVGTVTRQQLQDMPLYGIDVLGGVIETCQNEISQALNNRILDRVFKLGVENYKVQRATQGVDLNLYMGTRTDYHLSDFSGGAPYKKFVDLNGNRVPDVVANPAIVNTNAENVITHQRRIMSRMLAASNLVASVTRRGRAQWAVTNAQVLTALQDCAGFVPAPMVNDLVQGGEESLYFAGNLAGLKIYVDPYMRWDDTRICVGRKANVVNNRVQGSGVVFMPYILADQVQIIAEGTMAPKVLINSRFAIVDAGWYVEQNYYTFMVDFTESTLI
jgi:hypothetical protein